mmetsp:Transcript_32565/g.69800  ORF Transcript_32565/g.69800 Transcript_32565/m.69800 type:complete len:601 (-) Transcript_32565:105-1907(-)
MGATPRFRRPRRLRTRPLRFLWMDSLKKQMMRGLHHRSCSRVPSQTQAQLQLPPHSSPHPTAARSREEEEKQEEEEEEKREKEKTEEEEEKTEEEEEKEALTEELAALRQEHAQLQDAFREAMAQREASDYERSTAEEALAGMEMTKNEYTTLQLEHKKLQEAFYEAMQQREQFAAERDEAEDALLKAEAEAAALSNALQDIVSKTEGVAVVKGEASAEQPKGQTTEEGINEEKAEQAASLTSPKSPKSPKTSTALSAHLEVVRAQLEELKHQNAQLEEAFREAMNQRETFAMEREAAEEALLEAEACEAAAESEKPQYTQRIAALEKELEASRDECSKLEATLKASKREASPISKQALEIAAMKVAASNGSGSPSNARPTKSTGSEVSLSARKSNSASPRKSNSASPSNSAAVGGGWPRQHYQVENAHRTRPTTLGGPGAPAPSVAIVRKSRLSGPASATQLLAEAQSHLSNTLGRSTGSQSASTPGLSVPVRRVQAVVAGAQHAAWSARGAAPPVTVVQASAPCLPRAIQTISATNSAAATPNVPATLATTSMGLPAAATLPASSLMTTVAAPSATGGSSAPAAPTRGAVGRTGSDAN